jgi:hypothetical protein
VGAAGLPSSAADLQYAFRPGARFTYTYEIAAELEDKVGLFRGTNAYRVEANAGPGGPGKMVEATGTGFFVADGHLVTCAHVVNKATRISVRVGTRDLVGKVVGLDQGNDLALVQLGAKDVPLLPLGDSQTVQLAQNVRVVGFPLASVLGSDTKVTSGTVAGVSERLGRKILQVDASINPGNSGGPLVNDRGEVIGVASAKLAGVQISNVGFAVPVDEVKELLRRHHVSFTSAPPGQPPLPGPEIAKRVSPSVVLIAVALDSSVLEGEKYTLYCRPAEETLTRPAKEPHQKPIRISRQESAESRVVVDDRGHASSVQDANTLPFCLGFRTLVGIEKLPAEGERTWQVERRFTLTLTQAAPRMLASSGGQPSHRPPAMTRQFPVSERTSYELQSHENGVAVFKKRVDLTADGRAGTEPLLHLSGEGTVTFDARAGLVRAMHFTGRLQTREDDDAKTIPLRYRYELGESLSPDGPASIAGSPPPSPRPGSQPGRPDAPAERTPVPDAAARKKAEAALEEVFGPQMAAAHTAAAKLALVDKLLQAAAGEADVVHRYLLWNRARQVAVSAGELQAALRAVEEIVRQFAVDRDQGRRATLMATAATARTSAQQAQVAKFADALMEELMAADQLDGLSEIGRIGVEAARKASDNDLVKRIVRRGKQYQQWVEPYDATRAARATLQKDPKDPEASLAVGRYKCLVRQHWETGLPLLAQGSDPALKSAAAQDLAQSAGGRDYLAIGDAWWNLAAGSDEYQDVLRARALLWYKKAQPDLSGLVRAKIDQRLAQFAALLESEAVPAPSPVPAEPAERPSAPIATSARSGPVAGQPQRLLEHVAAMIKAKNELRSKEQGFTLGTQEFTALPPEGALLVGFDVSVGTFNKIVALRPLFQGPKGMVPGPVFGQPTANVTRVMAKRGYAVGTVTVAAVLAIDGLGITFMRIGENGLLKQDSYDSPWICNHADAGNRGGEARLGGDGKPLVGIFGHHNDRAVTALGVIGVDEKP